MHLGNGTLYHGDAIQIMRSLPAECIDMVFTDPPYRVISGGMKGRKKGQWAAHAANPQLFKHNDCSPAEYMPEIFRVLKPGTHCYVMTNNLNLRLLLNVAADAGFRFHNLLVWRKNTCTANRWYMKEMELVCMFFKPPARVINNPSSKQIFEYDNPRAKLHPTEKPVALVQHYIENSSAAGDLVLDPFAGSGSTAVAAQQTGRRWITFELDEAYYYGAVGRIARALAIEELKR